MKLYELIVEGYKEAQQEFTVAANNDAHLAKGLIDAYKALLNKNQIQNTEGNSERNIDYWRKQGFTAFKDFVVSKQSVPTSTEVKRKKLPGKAITLREDDTWLIVIPLDKDASCFHGKNSDWCTTKTDQSHFENYFYDKNITLIYCLNKKNAGMWAIATHTDTDQVEMFDQKDNPIDADRFHTQTGLVPTELSQLALKTHGTSVSASRKPYRDAMHELNNSDWTQYDFSKPVLELEKLLIFTRHPKLCASYAQHRYYGNNEKPVVLPKPIIMAIATDSSKVNYALQYVDYNSLPESFVLQVIKQSKCFIHILDSGYKPCKEMVNHIIDIEESPSEKEYCARILVSRGIIPDDDIMIDLLGDSEYRAQELLKAHKKSKTIPSEKLQKIIVTLYADGLEDMIKLGAIPSERVQLAAIHHTFHPSSAIYVLASAGIKMSDMVVLAACTNPDITLNTIVSMILNNQVPSDRVLDELDDKSVDAVIKLMQNKNLTVPKILQDRSST